MNPSCMSTKLVIGITLFKTHLHSNDRTCKPTVLTLLHMCEQDYSGYEMPLILILCNL